MSDEGRRAFMAKAAATAAVAGTAWALPSIATMKPAGAASLTSPPPVPPGQAETTSQVTEKTEPEVLAFTGAPITKEIAAGLAAMAGGGGMMWWDHHRRITVAGATTPPSIPDQIATALLHDGT